MTLTDLWRSFQLQQVEIFRYLSIPLHMWRKFFFMKVFLTKPLSEIPTGLSSTKSADKERLEASIWRAVRSGLYAADNPSFSQLVEDMDDNLFTSIRHNPHHVLCKLLPYEIDHKYNLRPRFHSFSLTVKTDCKNYINRMLYKLYRHFTSFSLPYCMIAFCQSVFIKDYDDDDDDDDDALNVWMRCRN